MPGIVSTLDTKHQDYVQEEQEGTTHHGIHFGKGIALVLIVIEHVVHSALLGQSTHLVKQLIGSPVVQDGNGAHLLPAAKDLCTPAPDRQHITEAVNHFFGAFILKFFWTN